MAEVKAQLNGFRLAPRKVRSVINLLKGKSVDDAIDQLDAMIKRPADPIKKLLSSAAANAENNFNMVRDNLYIKTFYVDEGVKLVRYRAKGFGRPEPIQKKTSHIKVVLDERVAGLRNEKKKQKSKVQEAPKAADTKSEEKVKTTSKKPEIKKESGEKSSGVLGGIRKKMFQRKAI
jgi:large subunit ribosomal protein L22